MCVYKTGAGKCTERTDEKKYESVVEDKLLVEAVVYAATIRIIPVKVRVLDWVNEIPREYEGHMVVYGSRKEEC